jgi:diguanylate cyclase (GGDEF)-like protein
MFSPIANTARQAGAHDSSSKAGGWSGWMLRVGHLRCVFIITLLSIIASVALTALVSVAIDNTANLSVDLAIAVVVPAVVAPLASYYPVGLLFELDRVRHRLEVAASHDALTGLFNRRYLLERLNEAIVAVSSRPAALSVVLIDVDTFKAINDRYGHAAGDIVLADFARALQRSLGEHGLVARYGGEEFVAMLIGVPLAQAAGLAEQARVCLESMRFDFDPAVPSGIQVTASLGVAALGAGRETADRLLASADQAMYAAKLAGRNRSMVSAALG